MVKTRKETNKMNKVREKTFKIGSNKKFRRQFMTATK